MIKALNKRRVPFDAFYRTIPVANDNLFTYHTIQKDLKSTKLQIIFLTSTNVWIDDMPAIKHTDPMKHFTLMPIASGMERLVVMCMTHLLTETNFDEDNQRIWVEMGHASACDMTIFS